MADCSIPLERPRSGELGQNEPPAEKKINKATKIHSIWDKAGYGEYKNHVKHLWDNFGKPGAPEYVPKKNISVKPLGGDTGYKSQLKTGMALQYGGITAMFAAPFAMGETAYAAGAKTLYSLSAAAGTAAGTKALKRKYSIEL